MDSRKIIAIAILVALVILVIVLINSRNSESTTPVVEPTPIPIAPLTCPDTVDRSNENVSCDSAECISTCNGGTCVTIDYRNETSESISDIVYHQHEIFTNFQIQADNPILEVERNFTINVDTIIPGTELAPGSRVYGYNNDQSLDINGGKAKSYNSRFKTVPLKYHGSDQTLMVSNTAENAKSYMDRIISYYVQRGYPMPSPDVTPSYDGLFVHSLSGPFDGQEQLGAPYLSMKFVYNKTNPSCTIPTHVDVLCDSSPREFGFLRAILDLYEPDQSKYKNGHFYPIRIPITTDFCGEFQNKYNTEPIAYYNRTCHKVTIRVPQSAAGHYLGFRKDIFDNSSLNNHEENYLTSLDATFSSLKRDSNNLLVPSNPKQAVVLVQDIELITASSKVVDLLDGGSEAAHQTAAPFEGFGTFLCMICPLMSGGSNSLDVYAVRAGLNSYATAQSPGQIPAYDIYAAGDASSTKFKETYSVPLTTTMFDNPGWEGEATFGFPRNYITGEEGFPEDMLTDDIPDLELLTNAEAYYRVAAHEFAHVLQLQTLMSFYMNVEGTATCLEMDPALSNNVVSLRRGGSWLDSLLRYTRGDRSPVYSGAGYGDSLFWSFLNYFDPNKQVMRRIPEILDAEKLAPLLLNGNHSSFGPVRQQPPNNTGVMQAMDQALRELYGMTLPDLWHDFGVCSTMMRNNTSIPQKYRHNYPFYLFSEDYSDFTLLSDRLGSANLANWWKILDTAGSLKNRLSGVFGGQVFTRELPLNYINEDVYDMRNLCFSIPAGTTEVTVDVPRGLWRVTMTQFTSDGTSVGTFIQDPAVGDYIDLQPGGSHTFDLTSMNYTNSGVINLICSNVSIMSAGGLRDYYDELRLSGEIEITRDGPATVELGQMSINVGMNTFTGVGYASNGPDMPTPVVAAPGELIAAGDECATLPSLAGRIGVVDADQNCNSSLFTLNVSDSGAVLTLIVSFDDDVSNWGGSGDSLIPIIVIGRTDGTVLMDYLTNNPGATITVNDPTA